MITINQGIRDKIKHIAEERGYEEQSRQLMEECAELIQAVNKYWRAVRYGSVMDVAKARENMSEEIADVLNMTDQIMYLTCCQDEVEQVLDQKVDRTLKEIEG